MFSSIGRYAMKPRNLIRVLLIVWFSVLTFPVMSGTLPVPWVILVGFVDGDTLKGKLLALDVPEPLRTVYLRIRHVNTAEKGGRAACDAEVTAAIEAARFTRDTIIDATARAAVRIENPSWDKFGGRILVDVFIDDRLLSDMLIERGLAVPYEGERKTNVWCPTNLRQ